MFQKFFTNTIQSKFIKSLLYNTPMPLIDSLDDGNYAVKGQRYIYHSGIIECTKTGIIDNIDVSETNGRYIRLGTYQLGDYIS